VPKKGRFTAITCDGRLRVRVGSRNGPSVSVLSFPAASRRRLRTLPARGIDAALSELAVALQQRAAASAQPPGVAPEAAEDRHVALSEHRLAQADGVPPADILALLLGLPITRLPVTRLRRPTRMPVMRAVSRTLDARPFVGMPRPRRRRCGERKKRNETQE
jgi:hypothetical protein